MQTPLKTREDFVSVIDCKNTQKLWLILISSLTIFQKWLFFCFFLAALLAIRKPQLISLLENRAMVDFCIC